MFFSCFLLGGSYFMDKRTTIGVEVSCQERSDLSLRGSSMHTEWPHFLSTAS